MIQMSYEAYQPELTYGIIMPGEQDIDAVRCNVRSQKVEANDYGCEDLDLLGILSAVNTKNDGSFTAEWAIDRGGHNAIAQYLTWNEANENVMVKQVLQVGQTALEIGGFCVIEGWRPTLFIGTYSNDLSDCPEVKLPLRTDVKQALRALTYGTAQEMRRLDGRRSYDIALQYDFGNKAIATEEGRLVVSNPYGW